MRHRLNSTTVARVVKFLGPVDACGISPSRGAACRPAVHRAASPLLPASRPALRRTVAEDKSSGAMLWKGTSTVPSLRARGEECENSDTNLGSSDRQAPKPCLYLGNPREPEGIPYHFGNDSRPERRCNRFDSQQADSSIQNAHVFFPPVIPCIPPVICTQ